MCMTWSMLSGVRTLDFHSSLTLLMQCLPYFLLFCYSRELLTPIVKDITATIPLFYRPYHHDHHQHHQQPRGEGTQDLVHGKRRSAAALLVVKDQCDIANHEREGHT